MRKTVIVSTCDRCGTEEQQPYEKNPLKRTDRYVLPKGWINVAGNTARTTVFEFDLCGECAAIVREAAGVAVHA